MLKKIPLFLLAGILCPLLIVAQAPQSFNYQAVARDGSGQTLTSQNLDVRFTIRESAANGSVVYEEEHAVTTNDFGLFTAGVGQGTVITGDFATISWGSNSYFLEVKIDAGNGYKNLGSTQLLSVPYAIYSNTSGSSGGYSAGAGVDISNNIITNTGDLDGSDDITTSTSAGGDVSGIYPTLTVSGLNGRSISNTAPATGQVLKWDGTDWSPANDETSSGGSGVWSSTGNNIYYNSGNVGVGITNPDADLDVRGTIELSTGGVNNEEYAIGVTPLGELAVYPNNNYSEAIFYFSDDAPFFNINNSSNTDPNGLRLYQNGNFKAAFLYQPGANFVNITRDALFKRIVLDGNNNVVIAGEQGDSDAALTINSQYKSGRIKYGSSEYLEDGGSFSTTFGSNLFPATDDMYTIGFSTRRWKEIYATNGVINTSDFRQKENITSISYGIEDLMKISPVSYQMKDDAIGGQHLGFVAQDLLEVFPEVVKTTDQIIDEETGEITTQPAEIYGVYYHRLIPVLVKSIQQQQQKIESLEREIRELKKDH